MTATAINAYNTFVLVHNAIVLAHNAPIFAADAKKHIASAKRKIADSKIASALKREHKDDLKPIHEFDPTIDYIARTEQIIREKRDRYH